MKKPVPSRNGEWKGGGRFFVFIRGISVIEMVVAVALVALIVTVIAPMFTAVNRSWDKDKRLKEQIQRGRDAMDFMIYELKKSNGIMDGSMAEFTTTATLDSNYVIFSSAGDEIVLDNDNSGYKENGTVNTVRDGKFINPIDGTVIGYATQGGFAGDYDASNTGYATYEFKTVLPGLYDMYSYFIATAAGTTALVGVFDDTCYDTLVADISSTFSQTTGTAGTWYAVNCSDAAFCTNKYGGAIRSLNLTAGGGTGGDCIGIKRTAGSNAIFDAFRLVYRGIRHKVFYLDTANSKITYGNDVADADGSYILPVNGQNYDDSLSSNATLLDNARLITGTPFLQYFQADGVTAATEAKDVALIKIAFQLMDPDGKLPPYPMRGQVMLTQDPSSKRLIINEIFKEENETEIAEERFDGNSNGDGDSGAGDNAPYTAGQADGGWYGFATTIEDIDGDGDQDLDMDGIVGMDNDAWLSATENFNDGNITGWTNVDCADGGEACAVEADGGDNVISITATDASDNTGSFFYEASQNYVAVIDFRIICNERQTFSFRMRHADTTDHISAEFYIDETGGTDVACLRIRRDSTTNGPTQNYPSGVDAECGSGGVSVALLDDNAIGNYDIYDDAEWHRLVVQDVYYTASVWLSEGSVTRGGLDAFTSANYTKYLNTINYDPAASRLDAYDTAGTCGDAPCPGVKGFEIDDALNGTATDDNACAGGAGDDAAHIHFDNIRIWSLDWKPIGYLTSFDDTNTVWDTDSGGNTPFMVRAAVDPAFGPQGDHTTGVGGAGMVLTSARDTVGDDELVDAGYSTLSTQTVEHRNNGQITLGNHNRDMGDVGAGNMPYFTFQYWNWWQWMDMDPDDDDACGFAIDDGVLGYPGDFAAESSLYPVNQLACPNSYGDNPTLVYDTNPSPPLGAAFNTELWTRDHACWVKMRMDLSTSGFTSAGNHNVMEMAWRFNSDVDGADGAGWFIDDVEYYPGGIWHIQDEDGADNYKSRATHTGRTVLSTGADNGSYGDFGTGDEDWLHAAVESPLVRITDAQDFNAVKVRFYLLMDMSDNAGEDGLFVQYSIDGGAWTSVASDQNSYFTQDGYDGILACNDPYDPGDNQQNDVGCNESAFFTDRINWTEVAFVVEDDTLIDGGTFRFRYQFTSDDGGNGADGVLIDSIRVYGLQRNYQFLEVYNPTPHPIDVDGPAGANNWRIVTDGHTGSADSFDAIRGFGNVNAAAIPPGGYAVITQRSAITRFYDGLYFAAPPASAIRLEIDDDFFGYRGFGTEFGTVTLQDNTGAMIDSVSYNVVFYDQLENYAGQGAAFTTMDAAMYTYSTLTADGGDGNITTFWIMNPTKGTTGGNRGPGRDHTSGRYGLDTGQCFVQRDPSAGTPTEDYDDDDAAELRTQGLDLSQTTTANVGNLEFWYYLNTDDTDDGFIVQLSSQGGNNLTIPFTGQPNAAPEGECEGKLKDGQTEGDDCRTGTDRLNPNYNSAISSGSNSLDFGTGQRAYHTDQFGWRKVTATLNDFVGGYALLRFYWEADNSSTGQTRPGLYLDDIVVWYHWGGGVFQKTLERKSWKGNSSAGTNWGTSSPDYGTPGYFNSIAY